jgi:hypothetical protein
MREASAFSAAASGGDVPAAITPNFTLNYGPGWEHETNLLNFDLPKPALLAPIYGSDLSPFNFSLTSPASFGRANQRVGQTFGSGGPRAGQIALRVSF